MTKKRRRSTRRQRDGSTHTRIGTVFGMVHVGSGDIHTGDQHFDLRTVGAREPIVIELQALRTQWQSIDQGTWPANLSAEVGLQLTQAVEALEDPQPKPLEAASLLTRTKDSLLEAAKMAGAALTLQQAAMTFGPLLASLIQRLQ